MHGFHHLRRRVRASRGLEPFPERSALKRGLDTLMYGIGFVAPLALLPQILQIYRTKSGAGVSLLTWSLLTVGNFMWGVYAAVHKDRQLLFANSLLLMFDIAIVAELVIY